MILVNQLIVPHILAVAITLAHQSFNKFDTKNVSTGTVISNRQLSGGFSFIFHNITSQYCCKFLHANEHSSALSVVYTPVSYYIFLAVLKLFIPTFVVRCDFILSRIFVISIIIIVQYLCLFKFCVPNLSICLWILLNAFVLTISSDAGNVFETSCPRRFGFFFCLISCILALPTMSYQNDISSNHSV